MKCLTIDIGGSSVKGAIVSSSQEGEIDITGKRKLPLVENNIDCLVGLVKELVSYFYGKQRDIDCVGISTTGSVNPQGIVRRAGFIEGYERFDWKKVVCTFNHKIEDVYTLNDGRASALGSYAYERLHNAILAHFVVGTGIGGGFVINGNLFSGAHDLGSNFGHIKIENKHGLTCSCRKKGCLENYASAKAIVRYYSNDSEIKISNISQAAKNNDPKALEAFKKAGFYLGIGISDIMNVLDPNMITIGGGIPEAARMPNGDNIYIKKAIDVAKEYAKTKNAELIEIKESQLGNNAGMVGVAYYSFRNLNLLRE